jgi:hypothetical protein
VKPGLPPGRPAAWRPPTRRAFVQMLAAIAVASKLRDEPAAQPPRPIWIGHF